MKDKFVISETTITIHAANETWLWEKGVNILPLGQQSNDGRHKYRVSDVSKKNNGNASLQSMCKYSFSVPAKHEMEVEIEKIVKAQNEAQSAAEIADREEQIAHNKASRTTSSRRRTRRNTSRKWKLNSRRSVTTSSLSWTRTSSAQEIILFERVDHEQVAEKRQTASQTKNDTNLAKQSDVSKNTQHNVRLLLCKSNR